jgi:hypothetical protein
MRRIGNARTVLITAAIALLTAPIAGAQAASDPAPAPIPIQILTGKKLFISNGENTAVTGVPNLTYNEFYASMKSWGKYELVPAPADADLVFEIRFVALPGQATVIGGGSIPSEDHLQLRLVILDPKSHVVLWAFNKGVAGANRPATARKNYDQAMANLVNDLKQLIAPPATQPDASANR